jgi:hypothetical protein
MLKEKASNEGQKLGDKRVTNLGYYMMNMNVNFLSAASGLT